MEWVKTSESMPDTGRRLVISFDDITYYIADLCENEDGTSVFKDEYGVFDEDPSYWTYLPSPWGEQPLDTSPPT